MLVCLAGWDNGSFGSRSSIWQGEWQFSFVPRARKPLIFKGLRAFCIGNQAGKFLALNMLPISCPARCKSVCCTWVYTLRMVAISDHPPMTCMVFSSMPLRRQTVVNVCPYGILRTNRESLENQGFADVRRVFILFQITRTSLKKSLIYWGCKMDDKRIRE